MPWRSSSRGGRRGPPRALPVNVEALSTVERAQGLVSEFVRQRRCYAVIDESTSIKEGRSKRSKFLISKVAHATYRRILSGLPTPRQAADIQAQFNFLQPERPLGFSSFVNFRARYATSQSADGGQVDRAWWWGTQLPGRTG